LWLEVFSQPFPVDLLAGSGGKMGREFKSLVIANAMPGFYFSRGTPDKIKRYRKEVKNENSL